MPRAGKALNGLRVTDRGTVAIETALLIHVSRLSTEICQSAATLPTWKKWKKTL